jgi:hypothetical protein
MARATRTLVLVRASEMTNHANHGWVGWMGHGVHDVRLLIHLLTRGAQSLSYECHPTGLR